MEEEEDGQGKQELAELAIQYGFKKKVTPNSILYNAPRKLQ
jgi:hypothetical protein